MSDSFDYEQIYWGAQIITIEMGLFPSQTSDEISCFPKI